MSTPAVLIDTDCELETQEHDLKCPRTMSIADRRIMKAEWEIPIGTIDIKPKHKTSSSFQIILRIKLHPIIQPQTGKSSVKVSAAAVDTDGIVTVPDADWFPL